MDDRLEKIARRYDLPVECQAELATLLNTLSNAPHSVLSGRSAPSVVLTDDETFPLDGNTDEVAAFVRHAQRDKYEDRGLIGIGGMGEVRQVRDRDLNRIVAMKIVRSDLTEDPRTVGRFVEEAQMTAQLTHPGIVPIHELGELPDGRLFFTMRFVQGREFGKVVRESYAAEAGSLHRLVTAFAQICEAVGYAHAHGVLHCDLKPSNILVEDHGIVQVVDWGLARLAHGPGPAERRITGTPRWMAPEQARAGELTCATDVYGLGAILFLVLAATPPYPRRSTRDTLDMVLSGPPPPVREQADRPLPDDLVELCEAAMARDPADRPRDARELAERTRAWLHGALQRRRARKVVEEAVSAVPKLAADRERAARLTSDADALRETLTDRDPIEAKRPLWDLEDEARSLHDAVELAGVRMVHQLQGALVLDPDAPDAHRALAQHYRTRHAAEEAAGRTAEGLLWLLASHDRDGTHAAYLEGTGRLQLDATPEATAQLFRYETVDRRLEPRLERTLGTTPLDVPLAMGSYLVVLTAPGHVTTRYPVFIERNATWSGTVTLPTTLGADEVYVPGGPFWSGGDDEVPCLERRRLWVDSFVVRKHPVTNAEFIAFLDALPHEEALQHVPRERGGTKGEAGPMIFGHDGVGFHLRADAEGDVWQPDAPVVMIDWHAARAFAAWTSEVTGLPWRLGAEFEWEKAARGVDGRAYPWGDHPDATWMCVRSSHAGAPRPHAIGDFPGDVSPYGVRGMAGNVRDWCLDAGAEKGAPVDENGRIHIGVPEEDLRNYRGGDWYGLANHARLAYRAWNRPVMRNYSTGFRLFRSAGTGHDD